MCGICGELTLDSSLAVRPETIVSMRDAMVHRGPDDRGAFIDPSRRVGLGFRRLRIIDLSTAANQPMANEDGSVQVVFNGEIYGFQQLRAELTARGHRFRSHSDTEVIVHLYEERGDRFAEAIDGMFAIAVWDAVRRRLVLARDRAGKKPLFYYRDEQRFVFGSEIKAIFAHPDVPIEIDRDHIPWYFLHGYVPHPGTFYRGVKQVSPASVLMVESDGRVSGNRYWHLRFPDPSSAAPTTRQVARARVRELVTAAVSRRLVSDVPLGAFLSAGIDSTVVVGVMSRLMSEPVKTFTIGFEGDAAYDETWPARAIAKQFNTEHTEFRVSPSAVDLLDRLIWHYDGPFGDSSAIPTYLVAQLTRPHVTVVLTGDGGDELFGGYLRFRAALAAERVPDSAASAARALLRLLPPAPNERHLLARARRFADHVHLPLLERLARWNSIFQDDLVQLLIACGTIDRLAHLAGEIEATRDASPLSRLLAANYASYLPDDLLVKTDRCTMAHSLEARAPLLDTALTEYAASLPDSFKIDGSKTKAILREAFADLIPPSIERRPKTGFGVPLDAWFRAGLRDFVRDTLLAPSARSTEYVRPEAVRRLVDEHQSGRANHGHRLWTLVCFERWLQQVSVWTAGRAARYDGAALR
jgi:asparagine synthase (glutamine-hydrolysing)